MLSGGFGLDKVTSATLTLSGNVSTYAGGTTISGGILQVTTLANGLQPSNIGQSTSDAVNLVLDGGRLRYMGLSATTNRLFTLTPSGGSLTALGTGPIDFTNTGAIAMTGAGSRILGLSGSYTGQNTLAASLGDPSGGGQTGVLKSGAGTWVLTAKNNYSGGTTIRAGTLDWNNNYAWAGPGGRQQRFLADHRRGIRRDQLAHAGGGRVAAEGCGNGNTTFAGNVTLDARWGAMARFPLRAGRSR